MNTTVPPAPPQSSRPAAPLPVLTGTGEVQNLPQSIVTLLHAGKNLTGEVTSKPQSGQIVVQTPQGQVKIQTPMPLPTGASVELSLPDNRPLVGNGPPYTLDIKNLSDVTVKSAPQPENQIPVPVANATGKVLNVPDAIMAQLAPGKAISAEVVAKPDLGVITVQFPQGKIDIQTPTPLPVGANVNITMMGINGPPFDLSIQHMAAPHTVEKQQIPSNTPTPASQTQVVIQPKAIPITSGIGVAKILPPPAVTTLTTGDSIQAIVTTKPQPEHIVVESQQGKFEVKTPLPLPTGATINLALGKPDGPPYELNIQHVEVKPAPIATQIPAQAAPVTSGTGQAKELPTPVITLLTAGTVVSATVTAKPQPEQITVESPQGKFEIKTPLPLPTGATINLALSKTDGPPFELNIQHVEVKQAPTPSSIPAQAAPITSGTGQAEELPKPVITLLTSGTVVSATVTAKPQPEQISVESPQGRFEIKTALPLPSGATIKLALGKPDGPPFELNIQHIEVKPSPAPTQPLAGSVATDLTAQAQSLPKPIVTLLMSGAIITAEVIEPSAPKQITLQAPQAKFDVQAPIAPPTGTIVNLTMAEANGPPFKLNIQTISTPALQSEPAPSSPTPVAPLSGSGLAEVIPPSILASLTSKTEVIAEVVAKPSTEQITVQTPLGKFNIETSVPQSLGSKVSITMSDEISLPPYKLDIQNQNAAPSKNETASPKASPQQTTLPPGSAVVGSGQAKTLPEPVLQILDSGKPVSGEIVAKPQTGQVIVQTPQGQMQLQTPLPLQSGSMLTLTLIGKDGPPFTLNIHAEQPSTNQAASSATTSSARSEIIQSLTNGATLTATIVKSNTAIPTPAQSTSTPPTPQTNAQASQTTSNPSTRSVAPDSTITEKLAPPAAVAPTKAANVAAAPDLPKGGTVPIKINAIQLPNGPALPSITENQAGLIQGEVISNKNGQLQIQTANSTLSISVHNPPPVGTLLLLSLEGLPTPPAITPQKLGGQEMMQRWDGLRDALLLLNAGDPAAAAKVMKSMPQVGVKLATSLLFFLNAFKGGSVENWFGQQNLQSLSKLSKASTDKLGNDFRMTQGRATDSAGNDWRSYNVPMMTNSEIEQLRLYMKDYQEGDDEGDDADKSGKRFVIEVNFTKLGPFQFDGVAKQKTVDLMIRTHKPLEDGMRDDIRTLFSNTIEALGLTGHVGFHVSPKFDIYPISEEITYGGGMTV